MLLIVIYASDNFSKIDIYACTVRVWEEFICVFFQDRHNDEGIQYVKTWKIGWMCIDDGRSSLYATSLIFATTEKGLSLW